jgi:alpha-N-arabinofuranosidase
MDAKHPLAGAHSPLVKLAGAEPRGIRQAGVTIFAGMAYTGRVVLAGEPGAKVAVSLVWGPNASDR